MPIKTIEYWVLMGAIALYTIYRTKAVPLAGRLISAVVSSGMAYSLSDSFKAITFGDEKLAMAAIMLMGVAMLDILVAIFQDRQFWTQEGKEILRDALRKRLGLKEKE